MILATPMYSAIKDKYPDAAIHVLTSRHNHIILEHNPSIEKIFIYEKTPLKAIKLLRDLRKEKYGYLIDPKDHFSRESRLFAKLIKAETKIGFNKPSDDLYDRSIPSDIENKELHFVTRCFNTLEHIGIDQPAKIPLPELFTSEDSENYVNNFLSSLSDKKLLVVNISASKEEKMWGNEKWAEAINSIEDRYNIVLTYAPPEKERARQLLSKCLQLIEFKSRSLLDVVSLLKKANLLITPDTALVHIASAFNIPLIALYYKWEASLNKFYPLSSKKEIILSNEEESIKSIEPHLVIKAYEKLLLTL